MRTCERCGRAYAEVKGASEQACPHCGMVADTRVARAKRAGPSVADPVSALGLAVRVWAKHPLALMLLWLPAVLANLGAALALASYQESKGLPVSPFDMTDAQRLEFLGVAVPGLVFALAIEMTVWTLVSAYVLQLEGDAEALARTRGRLAPAVGAGALLTVVFGAGLVLLVIPFLVFLHWFLFVPSAMAEGRTVSEAFAASRQFTRERRTYGFTALVVLAWVGVYLVETYVGLGVSSVFGVVGLTGAYADAVGGAIGMWALAPFIALLPASYWALAKNATAEAARVSPAAPAAERFRTTKCPQCGTLVPYAATGQPVDVTCPVCGRTGRVV